MNLGSKDEEGTSQEHVSLRALGAREQDPKSRQMGFLRLPLGDNRGRIPRQTSNSQTLRLPAFGKQEGKE